MTWKNGRQLTTLTNGDTSISYGYDSNSVRTTKTVNGVKYTYAYLNGQLMYETRGDAKFYYSYDSNGILYNVRYTLTDGGTEYSYYYTHNSRGDIVGIYNGAGELKAHYEYDAWGNVISITDNNGNAITNPNQYLKDTYFDIYDFSYAKENITIAVATVAIVFLVSDDVSVIGVADDAAIPYFTSVIWDALS